MTMDDALDVCFSDEIFGKLFRDCGFNLALVFAHLGWDVDHAQTFVEFSFSPGQTRETDPFLLGVLLNLLDMRLRAGLNKQRDRKLFWRHDSEPDLCAVTKLRDTSVLILDVAREDQLKLEKLLDHRSRIFCADDDVDNANRLFPAPQ